MKQLDDQLVDSLLVKRSGYISGQLFSFLSGDFSSMRLLSLLLVKFDNFIFLYVNLILFIEIFKLVNIKL